VAIGSIALDTLKAPGGQGKNLLGGSVVYFSMAASLHVPVFVLAPVGSGLEDREPVEFLKTLPRSNKIDTNGIDVLPGKTFRWTGEYNQDMNAETLETKLGVFENWTPSGAALKQLSQVHYDVLFLGNIHPQLQYQVLMRATAKVQALDTMNLWINTEREALMQVISKVSILFLNEKEAELLTGTTDLQESWNQVQSWGPSVLIVKKGADGSVLFAKKLKQPIVCEALRVVNPVDPTGCGDSFAGGFLGHLAALNFPEDYVSPASPLSEDQVREVLSQALLVGTATASWTVLGLGTTNLQTLTYSALKESYLKAQRQFVC
jgi:sugar/nucleoside kinase (ribokinase family)